MSSAPGPAGGGCDDERWLAVAIRLARDNVDRGGGPFGAVVVRPGPAGGALLGEGVNRVTRDRDPTAHAEVVAIRVACQRLEDFRLTGCVLVASYEPCPMCLATALWARVGRVLYGADRHAAAEAGFDDRAVHELLRRPHDAWPVSVVQLASAEVGEPFSRWQAHGNRVDY
jgi:guanine deaminase